MIYWILITFNFILLLFIVLVIYRMESANRKSKELIPNIGLICKGIVANEEDLPKDAIIGDVWMVDNKLFVYSGFDEGWTCIGNIEKLKSNIRLSDDKPLFNKDDLE